MFLQRQGLKSSKNIERVANIVYCDVFSTRGFKCAANTMVFFMFFTSSSQNKPTQNSGIYSVLTRQHVKTTMFETIFHIFSARARQSKNQSFFAAFLPPFIRTQTKLRLNLTFCLSQSLLQSSNPWAQKCCKLRCFMNVLFNISFSWLLFFRTVVRILIITIFWRSSEVT